MIRSRFAATRFIAHGASFVALLIALLLTSCGGGSASTGTSGGGGGGGGTGGGGSTPVTSGEYLWEVGGGTNTLAYASISTTTGALSSPTVAGGPASNPTAYPSVVVSPSGNFLCAFYWNFSEVETFEMTGPGLQLTPPLEPVMSIPYEMSMTMHPSGKFLYVVTSGIQSSIQEISLDSNTGAMTLGPAIEESADLRLGVFDPAGQFLFVNDLTGGRIFVYQVDETKGSLTAVTNSPFALPSGEQPSILAIGGSGASLFLYANLYTPSAGGGGITAFSINSSTGALTVVPGSPFQTGGDAPGYFSVDPSRNFLYASSYYGAIYGFAINTTTGALSQVPGSPVSTAMTSATTAIDPSDQYLYVTNYTNSTIYGFSINSTTGSLTALSGSPFTSVAQPEGLTMMSIQ